ncbi:hypothetical protein EDC94DRAFT_697752 [Helicostylum pulchrum]|nr:hypothetical protein EDC94DRAFT_697752 [Helicostylum pulchrum]
MTIELNALSYILLTTIFSAASIIAIQNGRHPDAHPIVINSQGEFSSLRYAEESATIKSRMYPSGAPLLSFNDQSIKTLSELYQVAFKRFKANPFLGVRVHNQQVIWNKYHESISIIQSVFSGLVHVANLVACSGKSNSFVGIYASTSPDAFMTEIACHWGGLVTIPIAAQATSSHLLYVIRNTLLTTMVIDQTHLDFTLQVIEGTSVKYIIVVDSQEESEINYFGVFVYSLQALKKLGQEKLIDRSNLLTHDSIASVYYSSNPKNNIIRSNDHDDQKPLGVVLTHKNLLSAISSYNVHPPNNHKITSKDRLMHSFAIDNVLGYVLQALTTYLGGSIAFEDKISHNDFNLDVETILFSIKELKPTIYSSGAPFLKQVQKLIANKYGNSFIFQRGIDRKNRYHLEGRLVSDCMYDMLVFRDIRQKMFGGHVRMLYMDDDGTDNNKVNLGSFYRAVLGSQLIKTFSRTETSSGITATVVYDYMPEKKLVGPPLPAMEIKLVNYNEFTAEDLPNPRGEIHVRGNNVFVGYWNNIEASMDAIHPDGWFNTNMVGEVLPNGSFLLLGSKNSL